MNFESNPKNPNSREPQLVAVLDIGSTSIRMQIGEIYGDGIVRKLDSFTQAINLGRDTFSKGTISSRTIEDCVAVLKVYRDKLREFGINSPGQIKVVATSGVRFATNRMNFVDRIFIATDFQIEPFEEAELHRVIYYAISQYLNDEPRYFEKESLFNELGGGTLETLMLDGRNVTFARTYALGALKLRNSLGHYDASLPQFKAMMEAEINKTIRQVRASCKFSSPQSYVAIGGDIRFAAAKINEEVIGDKLAKVDLSKLRSFSDSILAVPAEDLVNRFHISLTEAQTLGPALLTHVLFAQEFHQKRVLVANVNLRDGLLKEMAEGRNWSKEIQEQIIRSAIQIGRKFNFDEVHSIHVASLACDLFDQLQSLHKLSDRYRGLLEVSAILHDIGSFINIQGRHKHSQYLIQFSEVFGIGRADLELISLVARYHRRATPQPTHEAFANMPRERRVIVSKLAALLRLAKALDATNSRRIKSVSAEVSDAWVSIRTSDVPDVTIEAMEARNSGQLFELIFGKRIIIQAT